MLCVVLDVHDHPCGKGCVLQCVLHAMCIKKYSLPLLCRVMLCDAVCYMTCVCGVLCMA